MIADYFKLSRPEHAIKNFLIFLPPFFAHQIFDIETLKNTLIAFISFTMIAQVVYIINDIFDVKNDRNNPNKQNRPLASGRISQKQAIIFLCILVLIDFFLLYFFSAQTIALLLLFIYFSLNLAYSWKLKDYPIIDIFILASGFIIRVYYGGILCNIAISPWLFLCIFCGALCFATGKRRNEMLHIAPPYISRPVLNKYTLDYLNNSYYLLCGMTIVFFSLWTIFAAKQNHVLLFTIPLVIFILLRYNLIIETSDVDGDPVNTLLKDRILIFLSILFALLNFWGVYFA